MKRAVHSLVALGLMTSQGPALGEERLRHPLGEFEYAATSTGVLVAAPHGTFDSNTAPLAIDAAHRIGAGYVAAWHFTIGRVRINVNRPTEGAFLGCAQEPRTERAQNVYDAYSGLVAKAASSDALRLYVEIHGNSNPRTAQQVEIATVGITAAQAQAVKDNYAAMLSRVRESVRDFPELALLMEPIDKLTYTASCAKKIGVFASGSAPRGIHFEFPRSAREGDAAQGSAMLVADIVRRILD
jgi:hypothetical protein